MADIVCKFGGTSLACSENISKVRDIVKNNNKRFVIVSAPGKRNKDDIKITGGVYEDCLHSIREIRTYSEHDANGNWGLENYSRNNKNIYFRKQTITYY